MDRREQRKLKKAKARKRDLRLSKERELAAKARAAKRSRYPQITLEGTGRFVEFRTSVEQAIGQINFDDQTKFSSLERQYYRLMREAGSRAAGLELELAIDELSKQQPNAAQAVWVQVHNNLGEQIFQGIPEELRRSVIPFVNCQVLARRNELVVEYSELLSVRGDGGRIYFSDLKPEVCFDGQQYPVGFSDHALQQICSRLKDDRISYGASGDLFGFFAKCVHFEPVMLYPEQPALLMYDFAYLPGVAQYELYVKRVAGEQSLNWDGGIPYYRLGYCPIVIDQGFAKAKTFITPGYRSTPEYGLLMKCRTIEGSEKERLMELATRDLASVEMLLGKNVDHIKWFHENGIPQVVQMEREVFRYSKKSKPFKISNVEPLQRRKRELQAANGNSSASSS